MSENRRGGIFFDSHCRNMRMRLDVRM